MSRERREFGVQSDLLDAFRKLCETHARSPESGSSSCFRCEGDNPYLVYAELAGTAMDAVMRQDGVRPVAEVLLRAKQLADAIDFTAGAAVHHGMMAPCDVSLERERTGVTGIGLAQALIKAESPRRRQLRTAPRNGSQERRQRLPTISIRLQPSHSSSSSELRGIQSRTRVVHSARRRVFQSVVVFRGPHHTKRDCSR
jgi:hypothetical protein